MAKDPVCNMKVDEKTAEHISELAKTRYTSVLLHANNNSIDTHQNTDIETNRE